MNDLIQEFIDKTADEVDTMYCNDEFRDGFCEAVDAFKNAVYDFAQENIDQNETCKIIEYDGEYDDAIEVATTLLEELHGYKMVNYYTAEFNDVHFFIIILEGDKNETTKN